MLNMKKIVVSVLILLSFTIVLPPIAGAQVHAETENKMSDQELVEKIDEDKIIKNDLYVQFEQEVEDMRAENQEISEEDVARLLEKYDGAEITYQPTTSDSSMIQPAATIGGVTVRFVSGGINLYASNEDSLNTIFNLMRNSRDSITVFSAFLGVPLSFIASFIGGEIVNNLAPFAEASDIVSGMINSGQTSGGVRLTLGGAKAISSPGAT